MKTKFRILVFLFFVISCRPAKTECTDQIGYPAMDSLITDMRISYGICLEIVEPSATTWGSNVISFDVLSEEDYKELENYARLFREEFFKYPKTFVDKTKLKRVTFVKNLINQSVPVAAMPDYYQEILYMNIFEGNYDRVYQRHVVHHEYYHMIEEQLNGNAYFKDPIWAKMNPPFFQYGSGGINARSSDMSLVNHPQDGFISLYCMSGLEEDKAELYAGLMTTEEKTRIKEWAKNDKILNNKIKYLTGFLKRYSLELN